MEDIIEEIWKDVEKFGWTAISGNKQYYLDIIRERGHSKQIHWLECDGEVVMSEIPKSVTVIYECGECGTKFTSRQALYDHYGTSHKTNIPL